ncbi:MAG: type II secretion system protein, partial [Gammaproteobacteria bacterium]
MAITADDTLLETGALAEDPAAPIGQRLLARSLITPTDLERALAWQELHGGRLGSILGRLGALSEETLLPVLAEQ